MKKTKLLAPILTIAGLSAMVAPLMSLTSCGDKNKELKLTFVKGEHIANISCSSTPKINDQFVIDIEYSGEESDRGWKKLSTDISKTYISVDGTKLTPSEDYVFSNNYQITVQQNVIKSTNVKIHIGADASFYDASYKWTTTKMVTENNNQILDVLPNEAIKPADIEVTGIRGDKTTQIASVGKQPGQYTLKQTWGVDITDKFISTDGYKFTSDMIDTTKEGPTQVELSAQLHGEAETGSVGTMIFIGNKPTSATYNAVAKDYYSHKEVADLVTNETYFLCGKVGNGEHDASEFKITTALAGCEITTDEYGNIILKTGDTTGSIAIEATSRFDSTVKKTITLDVEQQEP